MTWTNTLGAILSFSYICTLREAYDKLQSEKWAQNTTGWSHVITFTILHVLQLLVSHKVSPV